MFTSQVIQSIRKHKRGIGTALWKAGWSSKVNTTATDGNLRQPNRLCNTVLDTKVQRVKLGIRTEGDMDTIKTKARLVHQGRAKRAGFIQSEYLPVRLARIAKSGNVITLQRGFAAPVPLERIIAMQPVLAAKVVTDVSGPLINIHRRGSGSAGQPGRGSRDQGKQFLNDRIGNCCPLRVSGHGDRG